MAIHVRFDGPVVILGNFARLMNDPRYVDAARDVDVLLAEGRRLFVFDLTAAREPGDSALGLLTTLTRSIRKEGGEVALAGAGPQFARFLEEMRMDSYWEVCSDVADARAYLLGLQRDDGHEPA